MKRLVRVLCCLTVLVLIFTAVPVKAQAAGNSCTLCGGNCGGIVTDTQPLHRVYGSTRYETSFALSDLLLARLGMEKYNTVIVASGTGFADALAGSYLAAKYNAPILLTSSKTEDQVRRYIQENVKPDGFVLILGGTQAVSGNLAGSLAGYSVQRLWGNNRYETNLAILNYTDETKSEVVVCTGKGFADSLSASAVGKPILLVDGSLTSDQKNFLAANSSYHYIIGGTGAVSEKVENQLRAYGSVERIGGNTRYETSALVAQRFFPDGKGALLAYAQNFPDGLCGGTIAHLDGWPMLLVADGKGKDAQTYAHAREIVRGYVLGGPGLISDATVREVFAQPRASSETRPSFDLGNCRQLTGDVCVMLLFVDDNESSWTEEEVHEEWNEHVIPGLDFLENWASNWGAELNFTTYGYYTGMTEDMKVKYDGHIYRQPEDSWNNRTILEDIALSLGFQDADEMDQFLRDFSGQEQIVYLVMANKDGRCYAYSDSNDDGVDTLEHCMIFTDFTDYSYEGTPATIAHEVLHLFGAEDYYDPYGDFPNRHAMAEGIYYYDIMLRTYVKEAYEEYNTIGAFTAYTVGWTHTCPPECMDERWWS